MRIHTHLQGGRFDGSMVTLLGPVARDQLRIASMTDMIPYDGKVEVEQYTLIETANMPIPTHLAASYRWSGRMESHSSLIDFVME
jgi:hypothetical protein